MLSRVLGIWFQCKTSASKTLDNTFTLKPSCPVTSITINKTAAVSTDYQIIRLVSVTSEVSYAQEVAQLLTELRCVICHSLRHEDLTKRFEDLLNLHIPQWIINQNNITAMDENNVIIQEEWITKRGSETSSSKVIRSSGCSSTLKHIMLLCQTLLQTMYCFSTIIPSCKRFQCGCKNFGKTKKPYGIQGCWDLRLQVTYIEPDLAILTIVFSKSFLLFWCQKWCQVDLTKLTKPNSRF